jgi:hypothetical protein
MQLGEVPYANERAYVKDAIDHGRTLSKSNPHVQTLLTAARRGVKEIQRFNIAIGLEAHLH